MRDNPYRRSVMERKNERIERTAERLDRELRRQGTATMESLRRVTMLPERDLLLALGWLARDGRVEVDGERISSALSEFSF